MTTKKVEGAKKPKHVPFSETARRFRQTTFVNELETPIFRDFESEFRQVLPGFDTQELLVEIFNLSAGLFFTKAKATIFLKCE